MLLILFLTHGILPQSRTQTPSRPEKRTGPIRQAKLRCFSERSRAVIALSRLFSRLKSGWQTSSVCVKSWGTQLPIMFFLM